MAYVCEMVGNIVYPKYELWLLRYDGDTPSSDEVGNRHALPTVKMRNLLCISKYGVPSATS